MVRYSIFKRLSSVGKTDLDLVAFRSCRLKLSMRDRFDYGLNPQKCGAVSAHLCDPETADFEFMLAKNQYEAETGRRADGGNLVYQIRQAFPYGEVTPEEANRIGYETAMRWTKGRYQFLL